MTFPPVVFVLGALLSGKSAQCRLACAHAGFASLDDADALADPAAARAALEAAAARGRPVLLDGFPRSAEEYAAWREAGLPVPAAAVLLAVPPAAVAARAEGGASASRSARGVRAFEEGAAALVAAVEAGGGPGVRRVDGARRPGEVAVAFQEALEGVTRAYLVSRTRALLESISAGDFEAYARLNDAALTAFEPEAHGHLVRGLDFHRFYFENGHSYGASTLADPRVRLMGRAAVVCYVRVVQGRVAGGGALFSRAYEETRVYECGGGEGGWRCVHFHRSEAPRHA